MGNGRETLDVKLIKPNFEIGETVFCPQREGVVATKIKGYITEVRPEMEKEWVKRFYENFNSEGERSAIVGFLSGIKGYIVDRCIDERIGDEIKCYDEVTGRNFYRSQGDAEIASRFLEVKADDETWKLAVGDRDEENLVSQYHIENCELGNEYHAEYPRDIFYLCWKHKGLMFHDIMELKELLKGREYESKENLQKITGQLELSLD